MIFISRQSKAGHMFLTYIYICMNFCIFPAVLEAMDWLQAKIARQCKASQIAGGGIKIEKLYLMSHLKQTT